LIPIDVCCEVKERNLADVDYLCFLFKKKKKGGGRGYTKKARGCGRTLRNKNIWYTIRSSVSVVLARVAIM